MSEKDPTRVMFVCLGNICRSPLAEGVFRHSARERGVLDAFEIASSGTGAWHIGQGPDRRMRQTASRHGISLEGLRGQQLQWSDLDYYDLILCMDQNNLDQARSLAGGRFDDKIKLFRSFDPEAPIQDAEVPDPYYGAGDGFERVYDIVSRTCNALLDELVGC